MKIPQCLYLVIILIIYVDFDIIQQKFLYSF